MLDTAVSILAAVALLMPGFIIAELSVARSARSSRSDLELALRALAYTLIIHLAFGFWTVGLVKEVGEPENWIDHWGAISAYVGVVLLAVPGLDRGRGQPLPSLGRVKGRPAKPLRRRPRRRRGARCLRLRLSALAEGRRLRDRRAGRPSSRGATSCRRHLWSPLRGRSDPATPRHLPAGALHGRRGFERDPPPGRTRRPRARGLHRRRPD